MQSPQFIPQGAIRPGERGVMISRMIAAGQERSLLGPPQDETEVTTKHRTYPPSSETSTDDPPEDDRSRTPRASRPFCPGAAVSVPVLPGTCPQEVRPGPAAMYVASRMTQRLTVRPGAPSCRWNPARIAASLKRFSSETVIFGTSRRFEGAGGPPGRGLSCRGPLPAFTRTRHELCACSAVLQYLNIITNSY